MSVFGWFNTQQADTFAKNVADDLAGRIPPDGGRGRKQVTPERIRNAHEAIVASVSAFARRHKLNWYTKAHMGNTFRWALTEKGYDKEFVETWTRNLLIAASKTDAA